MYNKFSFYFIVVQTITPERSLGKLFYIEEII